jgi:hypothetical protein
MDNTYSPVAYVYREVIQEQIDAQKEGKIFYFDSEGKVDSLQGKIIKMEEINSMGIFITLNTGTHIRIDRIITVFGKPGAAYDEYDSYGNQCLSCTGGYDLD